MVNNDQDLERRAKLRDAADPVGGADDRDPGLAGLKTRDLAREIGVANGAVYNQQDQPSKYAT